MRLDEDGIMDGMGTKRFKYWKQADERCGRCNAEAKEWL